MQYEGTLHEDHRWKPVEEFVTNFNEYHTQLFSPSYLICDDEYKLRWYGKSGHWINLGFPMYVATDINPENGAEIHNIAYGRLGIIMRLRIVKSAKNEEEQQDDKDNLPHGTKFLKEIMMPWDSTDRIVFTDSYFSSVPAAEELWKHGLRFIEVIKIETQKFPMAYLSNIYLHNWGYMSRFLTRPVESTKLVLGTFVWMDRNRRYFIFYWVIYGERAAVHLNTMEERGTYPK